MSGDNFNKINHLPDEYRIGGYSIVPSIKNIPQMKRILPFICLSLILFSCKSELSDSPKKTVTAFIEAAKTGNIAEIKNQLTQSDVVLLEIGENLLAQFDSSGSNSMKDQLAKEFSAQTKEATIEIKDDKINGNNATVNVTFSSDGRTETRPFSLLKEDGKWKISLISTGLKNAGAKEQDIKKMLQSHNLDSLKQSITKGLQEQLNSINKDSLKKVIEDRMKTIEKRMKVVDKTDEFPKQHS